MENDAATLFCPNENCQAANPLTHKFCQRCSTSLPKIYLWAVVDDLSVGKPGESLADRYLIINQSLLLDTKPGFLPQPSELDNLQIVRTYLRLIPYRLHVPQVYGLLSWNDGSSHRDILLLEKPPLFTDDPTQQVRLGTELTTAWRDATSMRQLNWLWQLANLWQPLASEGVASSLLTPHLLRTEGSLVRLLELRFDSETAPGLPQLGEFWQQLLNDAKPAIQNFLSQISNSLIEGKINSAEQLIAALDGGLAELGRSQTPTIKIITKTDTGPSRQRNEDSCYPPSGTLVSKPPQPTALAIVCDGIGGHEGGNVASNLAIETIQQQVQQLTKVPYDHIDPSLLLNDLDLAVAAANDKISQRNDGENRQGRQRMGTTLVMALPVAHEMYITHVGDSRAYWITRQGCYQVTLDDDVASREVRLGYSIYREALQQSASGSLVQALGMGPSSSLHPTSARFMLDEDAVFLLTSDGFSDFDRVDEYWETEILPILTQEADLTSVVNRLVEIANTRNGHDNVTIALVHYQVQYWEPEITIKTVIPEASAMKTADFSLRGSSKTQIGKASQKTQIVPENKPGIIYRLPLTIIVPIILGVGAWAIVYSVRQGLININPFAGDPTPTRQPTSATTPAPRSLASLLAPGLVIKTTRELVLSKDKSFPPGTVFEVIKKKPKPQSVPEDFLVDLRVCPNQAPPPLVDTDNQLPSPPKDETVTLNSLQLKRSGATVLPENETNFCTSASSTVTPPIVPSPTQTNTR
ncbi:MAG: protein phosphatase 2C domain-containing protein [Desmonostoc vinosum HA7617-LM4]|jgi:protein phosphatase|nr:protein phosphatase 2C domain-containing protein [Desmonostoc vinosum HA7617-LM4]